MDRWFFKYAMLTSLFCFMLPISNCNTFSAQETEGDQSPIIVEPRGPVTITYLPKEIKEFIEKFDYEKYSRYTQSSVKEASIGEYEKEAILQTLHLVKDKNYSEAKKQILSLHGKDTFAKNFKKDYITTIYFGDGDYHEALRSILEKYQGLPLNDVRYRWEFAYVCYFYRRAKGRSAVEKSISDLQRKYNRKDISHVWMAIHPKALLRLLISDLYPYQNLHEKQLDLLRYVIQKYPDDPFIDHAYYFLHDYDKIIRSYPNSVINDRAFYARAYLEYYNEVLDGTPTREILLGVGEKYIEFITKFPHNSLTSKAFWESGETYLKLNSPKESINSILILNDIVESIKDTTGIENPEYSNIVQSHIYEFFRTHQASSGEKIFKELLHSQSYDLDYNKIKHNLAWRFFKDKNYKKSFEYYRKLPKKWVLHGGESTRVEQLEKVIDLYNRNIERKEYLFELSMYLKDTIYSADHAIPLLDEYLKNYATKKEIPKIMMLKAFCYRNISDGENMIKQYGELVQLYPDSSFADDALAEIGLYYLIWFSDYDKARSIFSEVIKKYPNGNAVDNCYNWIAWSFMKEANYRAALKFYLFLIKNYVHTRFSNIAFKNVATVTQKVANYQHGNIKEYVDVVGIEDTISVISTKQYPEKYKIAIANNQGVIQILDKEFSRETKFSGFKLIQFSQNNIIKFNTEDKDWKVQNFWALSTNKYYFIALNKKDKKAVKSSNLRDNKSLANFLNSQTLPFEKIGGDAEVKIIRIGSAPYKKQIAITFPDGSTKKLKIEFTPETQIEIKKSIRYKGNELVKFNAKDQAWKVTYIWDPKNSALYYQAINVKTHKTKKSLNLFNNNETTRFIKSQLK